MKFLLDTNICIALLKENDPALVARMKSQSPGYFALCSVVKGELYYGARKSRQVDKNLRLLSKFFAQFPSLPFDDPAAELFGVNRAILEQLGTPIGQADLLISSIALSHDLSVVTRNRREFLRVPNLKLEIW